MAELSPLRFQLAHCDTLLAQCPAGFIKGLGDGERMRLEALDAPRRREQFIAARWLLRSLLVAQWGGVWMDWAPTADWGRAPFIPGRADCHLSLSHSGDLLAAAVGRVPVGIDVECPGRRVRPVLAMAQEVCHPSELAQLQGQTPEQAAQDFLVYWTQKEAWLKRKGLGLDMLRMASVTLNGMPQADADTWSWQTPAFTLSVHAAQPGLAPCGAWPEGLLPDPPVLRCGLLVVPR